MTAHDVTVEIITPMRAVFATPRRMDEEAERVALREYVNALERYDSETLRKAWAKVRDGWTRTSWPTIGDIVRSAREFLKDMPRPERDDDHRSCWEGGPRCTRCLRKERSGRGDFWIAKPEEYRHDEQVRSELDVWFRALIGAP